MSFHQSDKKHDSKKVGSPVFPSANRRKTHSIDRMGDTSKNDPEMKQPKDLQSSATKAPRVEEVLWSPGQPLDDTIRDFMETRFGDDFSQVRVHTDEKAKASAREVGASAYTAGKDVVFGERRYDPASHAGRQLLAHELTHVIQQARGGEGNRAEQRAVAAARGVMHGETVSPAQMGGAQQAVQMQPDDPQKEPDQDKPAPLKAPGGPKTTLDKFGLNLWELSGDHRQCIDALAAEIAAQVSSAGARATISISGHTDTSGDEKYNIDLGMKRAKAAKAELETALKRKKVSADRIARIVPTSAGEKNLAVETKDNVKEPLNRRVVITVKIEGMPASVPPPTSIPSPNRKPEKRNKPIDFNLPRGYKVREETLWERWKRERKAIEEYDRKHPRKKKSVTDYLIDLVTKALEPLIKELPKGLRGKAREGIRKGIEAGTEKGCEAAIDASSVSGEKAEAMKAACKAALKTKVGGTR